MKKLISVALTIILLMFSVCISASAEEVTDMATGMSNVQFSNGYIGFCIDNELHTTGNGDVFTPSNNTSVATNNKNSNDVSQKLKILFTQCFDDIFTSDGNGGYHISKDIADGALQTAIYHYTDNYWPSGLARTLVNKVEAYNGPEIPDEGYELETESGETITFYFMVMEPQKTDQQSFFAYKLVISDKTTHEHVFGDDWKSDDDNHWHECECEEKSDLDGHDGTTADCKNSSVCKVCGKTLGDVNPDNHTGETEIRNAKPATETEEGYTGDTHCKDCGKLLEKGTTIPATHEHVFGDDWESDNDNHWHECKCGEKGSAEKHTVSDGKCITCGMKFNEEEKEPDISIDLDSILGALPEIDLDFILGIIPGFGTDNDKDDGNTSAPESDKETDTEIPDTGSDSGIAYVFTMLSVSISTVAFFVSRRKKRYAADK